MFHILNLQKKKEKKRKPVVAEFFHLNDIWYLVTLCSKCDPVRGDESVGTPKTHSLREKDPENQRFEKWTSKNGTILFKTRIYIPTPHSGKVSFGFYLEALGLCIFGRSLAVFSDKEKHGRT